MRGRKLLLVSLAANLGLAVGWFISTQHASSSAQKVSSSNTTAAIQFKTNVVVRRQFFSWREVESSDYPTYIANLRDIACPEQTIHDIIIADVNTLFSRRRALEIVTPDQQWWRSEPDTNIAAVAEGKTRVLDEERRNLLAQLLGPNWESGDLVSLPRPSQPALVLDGPVLGVLPTDVKETVEQITLRSQKRIQDYVEAQRLAGKEPDLAELARLRQQARSELAGVLTPPQVEEYLLRYSDTADNLRTELGDLRFFNATPDEFRNIFHAVDRINEQLAAISDSDPQAAQTRASLELQREAAIKNTLGEQRFKDYMVLHDPGYRDAMDFAQGANLPQSAPAIYEINQAAAQEQNRILSDTNLTAEQRSVELKKVELLQSQANAIVVGQPLLNDEPPLPPATSYTLIIGDNIASVSLRFGIPMSAIRAANPDLDLRNARPGDRIRLPEPVLTPVKR